jgi:hypothetical protein
MLLRTETLRVIQGIRHPVYFRREEMDEAVREFERAFAENRVKVWAS